MIVPIKRQEELEERTRKQMHNSCKGSILKLHCPVQSVPAWIGKVLKYIRKTTFTKRHWAVDFGLQDRTFWRHPISHCKGLVKSGESTFFGESGTPLPLSTESWSEQILLLNGSQCLWLYLSWMTNRRAEKDLSISCKCTQLAFSLHLPCSTAISEEHCKLETQHICNVNIKGQTWQHMLTCYTWYTRRHNVGSSWSQKENCLTTKL